jgi:hypothetical protein
LPKKKCALPGCEREVIGCNCPASWRNVTCSPEHFNKLMSEPKYEGAQGSITAYKLRAGVTLNQKKVIYDIRDYIIETNNIQLITTKDGIILNLQDTDYLIILNNEKQYLLKEYVDNGSYLRVNKSEYERQLKFEPGPI